jgi:hypothetical protein
MRLRQTRNWHLALIVLVLPAMPAYGQGLLDAVRQKATQIAIDELARVTEKDADTARSVSNDRAFIDHRARAEGKKVVLTNRKGKPLPPEQWIPAHRTEVARPGRPSTCASRCSRRSGCRMDGSAST